MISDTLKSAFLEAITFDPIQRIATKGEEQLPVDYFAFYQAISSVYSSKIEGENIDFDSFLKSTPCKTAMAAPPDYSKNGFYSKNWAPLPSPWSWKKITISTVRTITTTSEKLAWNTRPSTITRR
jgi:hypothetical protein